METGERNDSASIRRYYDAFSRSYDSERHAGYFGMINSLEFEMLRDRLSGKTVLELGCGTGLILERVRGLASRAVGVDLSEGMLRVAEAKGLEVVQGSATELPFETATFDLVYSFKVLPHVPDLRSALHEVCRVLKPEGVAFLEFYNPFSFKFVTNRIGAWLGRGRTYVRYDTLAAVRRALPAGFEVRSARGIRIFGVTNHFYTLPGLGRVFKRLDRRFCDSWMGRFGSYLLVELGPPDGS